MQQDMLDHLKITIHEASVNEILWEFSSFPCSSSEPGCSGDSFWLDHRNAMVNLILHGLDRGQTGKVIKNNPNP